MKIIWEPQDIHCGLKIRTGYERDTCEYTIGTIFAGNSELDWALIRSTAQISKFKNNTVAGVAEALNQMEARPAV